MKRQYALALVAMLLILASCHSKKEQAVAKGDSPFVLSDSMQHMIQTDTVGYCNIGDEITLSGEVDFNENKVVKIFPRSGGLVVESKVSLGDHIEKGQVLAIIKSADIAGNYSDLSSAIADVNIARRQMDNVESMYKNGLASEREYTEAKQNYEKSLAAKAKVQSAININGGGKTNASGQYIITAPIDGYIVDKKIATGSFIRPDMGDNLFTISDLRDVWVIANVYAQDIPKVKEGYKVSITTSSYPDKVFSGKIDNVSEVLDPQSKALRARITLENKDLLLKPDMYVKVIVTSESDEKAICVPTAALIPDDGKNYVIAYGGKEDVKIIEVNVLRTVGDKTYVTNALSPGQRLITKFQNLIFAQLADQ